MGSGEKRFGRDYFEIITFMSGHYKKEKIGIVLVLLSAAFWGLFPVLVHDGVRHIPPLTFAAISTILAAVASFVYLVATGKQHELKKREAYTSLFMISLCIVIIPYTLFFIGAGKTSGVNTSMLLLSELIFTLFFTPLFGERNTRLKYIGVGGVFIGALFILYNGTFRLNTGDILIVLSTLSYPIGNFYSKRALNLVSTATILFTRFLLGGIFVLFLARMFEPGVDLFALSQNNMWLLLFNGLILLGVSKVLWYEGLRYVDISKAVSLVMTFPFFSLLALTFVYKEAISLYQWIGIVITFVGVYFCVKRPSADIMKTRYAPSR